MKCSARIGGLRQPPRCRRRAWRSSVARMDWPSDGQLVRRVDRPLAGLGVPLAEQGDDHLLDQAQLPVHRVAVEPQVARLDPVGPECAARLARVRASSS